MTREEFIKTYDLEDETIIFEPFDDFAEGIVGITENHCQIVYSYQGMIESLARKYEKEYYEQNPNIEKDEGMFADFLNEATEWVDYNTIRSLPYLDVNYRPIIMIEKE